MIASPLGTEGDSGALAHCERIATARTSHLGVVARGLGDPVKQALFLSCYLAMRVIDDAVDNHHFALPGARRRTARPAMAGRVERWLDQATAAAAGRFRAGPDSFEGRVFTALNRYAGASEIGPGPWRDLAGSMRSDVSERGLRGWDDFDAYCRGAAVAPARVFVYILACRVTGGATTELDAPAAALRHVADMAHFCYLVHILRDLPADTRKPAQLITIPRQALSAAGLDKGRLRRAVARRDLTAIAPLIEDLGARAGRLMPAAERLLVDLAPWLGAREQIALDALYRRYHATYALVARDYRAVLEGRLPA